MEQVAPSVLFQFSYVGLLEIQELYETLKEAKKLMPASKDGKMDPFLNYLQDKGIKVTSIKDLNLMINFLNQSVEVLCYLYFDHQKQVSSKYDQFFSFYIDLQRASGIGKERKTML